LAHGGWASCESIHGPITVRRERDGERFALKATIPANTTATAFLPARKDAAVQEGGAPAEQRPGVKLLRREGDRAVFAIESGSYTFETRLSLQVRAQKNKLQTVSNETIDSLK